LLPQKSIIIGSIGSERNPIISWCSVFFGLDSGKRSPHEKSDMRGMPLYRIVHELPPVATRLARQGELQDNWQRARDHKPREKVAGPDADE
jgi:hypothetical protein